MAIFIRLLFLLVASHGPTIVSTLNCHSCTNVTNVTSCNAVITCGPNEKCFSSTAGTLGNRMFTMGCRAELMRKYSQQALASAIEEIRNGPMGLRAVAKKYSIPVTTLHDRMSGKINQGAKWGKNTLLSSDKEQELVNYAIKRAGMGLGFSKQSFLKFAGQFAASEGVSFRKGVATEKWWRGLKKRHPEFSLRSAEVTSSGRHMSMTRMRIATYFKQLKKTLDDNNLMNQKKLIWNMDETGLCLAQKPPKVLAKKGCKVVHTKSANSKELVTIIACGNADGTVIPPHAIVPGKTKRALNSYDTAKAPEGTNISVSDSGWTKRGISELWFTETFLPNIGTDRPQVLIMDGHESHHHIELIEMARKAEIILVELPSKTSHFTQPFDRSVFKALKTSWGAQIQEFTTETGVTVGHAQFFRLLTKPWKSSMTTSNVKNGFAATGICPYNPGALPDYAYEPAELYEAAPEEITENKENVVINVKVPETGDQQVVELPVVINEAGIIEVISSAGDAADVLDVQHDTPAVTSHTEALQSTVDSETANTLDGDDEFPTTVVHEVTIESTSRHDSSATECTDEMALQVIESAITTDMLQKYNTAYSSGKSIQDSMFTTWKMYREKTGDNACNKGVVAVAPSNPLLTLPKQTFSKTSLKAEKKPHFFVISSEEAYREKLQTKLNKEQKKAEIEERKRLRLVKKEEKQNEKNARKQAAEQGGKQNGKRARKQTVSKQ